MNSELGSPLKQALAGSAHQRASLAPACSPSLPQDSRDEPCFSEPEVSRLTRSPPRMRVKIAGVSILPEPVSGSTDADAPLMDPPALAPGVRRPQERRPGAIDNRSPCSDADDPAFALEKDLDADGRCPPGAIGNCSPERGLDHLIQRSTRPSIRVSTHSERRPALRRELAGYVPQRAGTVSDGEGKGGATGPGRGGRRWR